jgi:arsenate reductase
MKATIWHNPACGTSRNTLALLHEAGAEVTVIEYLKTPPSAEKLAQLYRDAGITRKRACASRAPTHRNAACPMRTTPPCSPPWPPSRA